MSDSDELRKHLAAKQNELDKANREMEDVKRIIEKQDEICRKVDTFKQLVNSLANSMNKGEYYDITRFSDIESCFQTLNESAQYVPNSAMSEFRDCCDFLDSIIKIKLNGKECTPIEQLKFTQVQGKIRSFLSREYKSCGKKLPESSLDAMRNKIIVLNNEINSLKEKLRAAENAENITQNQPTPSSNGNEENKGYGDAEDVIKKKFHPSRWALEKFFDDDDVEWFEDDSIDDDDEYRELVNDWIEFWDDDEEDDDDDDWD